MSLFAGIYAFKGKREGIRLPKDAIKTITWKISRSKDNQIYTHETQKFFLAYVDVGAFHEPGLYEFDGSITCVAGEPLLNASSDHVPSRYRDLIEVSQQLNNFNEPSILSRCRGSFAICHYQESSDNLWIATDKVGIRPVYYYFGDQFLYFSTSLRILEELVQVPKRMDMQALTEEIVLGYPLANRTPYVDIKILLSGEFIRCIDGRLVRSRYYRLEDVDETQLSKDDFLDALYESFVSAVACRSNRDIGTISLLSGGLDSRCIVGVLKDLGKYVSTIVFDAPDTPDRMIANRFASMIGSHHHIRDLLPGRAPQELLIYGEDQYDKVLTQSISYPQLVFSGDDGSISVGYVYLGETEVQLMQKGKIHQAVEHFLHNNVLPRKVFRTDIYQRLKHAAFEGTLEELKRIDVQNPERAFYFFHLENSHRRILRKFVCEDIDVRRIEYLQPFYDGQFIELIASAPTKWCLYHQLYHEWLTRFPREILQVPWQTYPGHLPCPVKGLTISRTQWQPTRAKIFWSTQPLLPLCWKAMIKSSFPSILIRRSVVLVAYFLHRMKIKNYSYIISLCVRLSNYFEKCDGHIVFP